MNEISLISLSSTQEMDQPYPTDYSNSITPFTV